MKDDILPAVLGVLIGIIALSFPVALLGGNTTHYQCKYVDSVKVLVEDHGKHDTAVYQFKYSDGTTGIDNQAGRYAPAGVDRGQACRIIFNWGWPYTFTNRNIQDESSIKK